VGVVRYSYSRQEASRSDRSSDQSGSVRIGILFGAVLRFGPRGLTELGLAFLGRAKLNSLDLPPIVFLPFNQLYSPLL
jgi:hypothetical protein